MLIVMVRRKYYRIVRAGKNIQERMHSSSSKTNSTQNSINFCSSQRSFFIKAGCKKDMLKMYSKLLTDTVHNRIFHLVAKYCFGIKTS